MITASPLAGYTARLRAFMDGSLTRDAVGGADLTSGNDDAFTQLALDLFALQFDQNSAWRRLCDARGVSPHGIHDWRDIPAAPTSAFKELDLTSLPPSERAVVFHSSGTTGQRRSRHFHDPDSLALYEASLLPWFRLHLLPETVAPEHGTSDSDAVKPMVICLTPNPAAAPYSSLVHMFETVRRRFGSPKSAFVGILDQDGAWRIDFAGFGQALNDAKASRRPVILLSSAFNFVHLLEVPLPVEFVLPDGSCVLETGGYKGRSRTMPKRELHDLITRRLGVPASRIVCEYGMSELSSQAYDRVAGNPRDSETIQRAFRFPPWARAQVVSPESGCEVVEGATGLLRIFDLANVRSVLAVQTEDLAIRRGDGFELLGRSAQAEPRGCSLMGV